MSHTAYFLCPWTGCGNQCHDCKSLLRHMYLMHGYSERSQLICGIDGCVTVCSSTEGYRKHVQRFHRLVYDGTGTTVVRSSASTEQYSESSDAEPACVNGNGNVEAVEFSDLMQMFSKRVLLFSLRIREQFLLPKTTFCTIMSDVKDLVSCYQECINTKVADLVMNSSLNNTNLMDGGVLDTIWHNLENDAKLKRCCVDSFNLIEPEEVLLGTDKGTGKKETCQYISVSKTLQHYLQHQDVWDAIRADALRESNESILMDYTDGTNFEQHDVFQNHPNAIRLHGYIDDFEVCNPLGSARSKHKLTAVYYYIGNLPKMYSSSLRAIHVALLVRTAFVKKYSLTKVLEVFVTDLRKLETEGILVTVDSAQVRCFASLATMSADNLGSHQLGGFRMSFSSGRVCRYCMVVHEDLNTFVCESDAGFPLLRAKSTHDAYVQSVLADSTFAPVYGINGQHALAELSSFHPTHSLPPDCMHDMLEGVIPVCITAVLKQLIVNNVLTVTNINERMSRFTYSIHDRSNAAPLLPTNFPKKGLLGSASQMWVFMRILPFFVGDLVDVDNDVWDLYLILRDVCDIVFAPAIHKCWLPVLQQLIADMLRQLMSLCNCKLTPKCHYLIHYPRMISMYGPLRHLWCMRFEAYHRYLKAVATSLGNFVNISKTLADRNQMKKCYDQAGVTCLESPIEVSSNNDPVSLSVLPAFIQSKVREFFGCGSADAVVLLNTFECQAVKYGVDDLFVIDIVHEDVPIFLKINYLVAREGLVCVVGQLCMTDLYLRHYHSYSVRQTTEWITAVPGFEKDYHAYRPYRVLFDGKYHHLVSLRHRLLCT